jgi:hypothetical protein
VEPLRYDVTYAKVPSASFKNSFPYLIGPKYDSLDLWAHSKNNLLPLS